MKALQKRIGILCLVALMLVATLCTVSCDTQEDVTTTSTNEEESTTAPDEGGSNTTESTGFEYTVFVTDNTGNAISGVKIQFCSISRGYCYTTRYTDEGDGIIKVTMPKDGDYKVIPVGSSVPEGYTIVGADAEGYFYFDENRTVTIVLQGE